MNERIQTLDGLRFLAALGVLWIHTWTYFGNPRAYLFDFDIANILALGGNGVDLFFVISGFCMYFFYARKSTFTSAHYWRFLKKRWFRLSPAYYTAVTVYLLVDKFIYHYDRPYFTILLNSLAYANVFTPQYSAASHFWTLGVEWQFYVIIPFILMYQYSVGFKKIFLGIFLLLQLLALVAVLVFKNQSDIFINQIFFRGIEFGWGVLVAWIILNRQYVLKYRYLWLIAFTFITYSGRIFISKSILLLSPQYYNLFKIAGFTLMGLGFAGILYMAITSSKYLLNILGNPLFKTMGKLSYSTYLWHNLMILLVAPYIATFTVISNTIAAPILSTLISIILLYPVSLLSYNLLEKPFLQIGNLTSK